MINLQLLATFLRTNGKYWKVLETLQWDYFFWTVLVILVVEVVQTKGPLGIFIVLLQKKLDLTLKSATFVWHCVTQQPHQRTDPVLLWLQRYGIGAAILSHHRIIFQRHFFHSMVKRTVILSAIILLLALAFCLAFLLSLAWVFGSLLLSGFPCCWLLACTFRFCSVIISFIWIVSIIAFINSTEDIISGIVLFLLFFSLSSSFTFRFLSFFLSSLFFSLSFLSFSLLFFWGSSSPLGDSEELFKATRPKPETSEATVLLEPGQGSLVEKGFWVAGTWARVFGRKRFLSSKLL